VDNRKSQRESETGIILRLTKLELCLSHLE
jgi:hypothetical protein